MSATNQQHHGLTKRHGRRVVIGGIVVAAAVAALTPWFMGRRQPAGKASATVPRSTAPAGGQSGGMSGMHMSSGGTVQLTTNQIRQFGVTFGTVDERMLDNTIRTVGTVAVDETTLSDVTPRFGGYVERLYVDATGQQVRKGQPLMDVYSPEMVAAEQELLVAAKLQASVGASSVPGVPPASTDLMTSAKRRFALWNVSDAQVDSVLETGQVRRTLTLYAPASGVVLEKNVVQGQAITAGAMLYRIANLRDVWIDVALREHDAGSVRPGSRAAIALGAAPGRTIGGRVAYVYPTVDSAARTVRARVEVPNPNGMLKPGMFATVTLATPTRRALTVPASAVLNTGDRTLVFMDMGSGRLMPMDVQTGRTAGGYTEVLSGLEAGQRVVTSAQYLLDSESNLAEVMKSMIGQMTTSDVNRAPPMDMKNTHHTSPDTLMKGMKIPPESTPRR